MLLKRRINLGNFFGLIQKEIGERKKKTTNRTVDEEFLSLTLKRGRWIIEYTIHGSGNARLYDWIVYVSHKDTWYANWSKTFFSHKPFRSIVLDTTTTNRNKARTTRTAAITRTRTRTITKENHIKKRRNDLYGNIWRG